MKDKWSCVADSFCGIQHTRRSAQACRRRRIFAARAQTSRSSKRCSEPELASETCLLESFPQMSAYSQAIRVAPGLVAGTGNGKSPLGETMARSALQYVSDTALLVHAVIGPSAGLCPGAPVICQSS
jgi:hypothetical protein